ncbi:hypothetical protein IKU74_08595 [bacterium]|nr:hypothetical protein [bacterium]
MNMRINGILNDNKYNQYNKLQYKPAFEGYVSAFSKKLDEVISKDFCSMDESRSLNNMLIQILKKRLKNNDVLGEGTLARVFKIDSKYAMRLDKMFLGCVGVFDENYKNPYKDLHLKTYYGDFVAKFGGAQILRNVSSTGKHIPAGVPQSLRAKLTPEECQKYYAEVYLPKFASLPQKSYDDVASDFSTLNLCYDDDWYRFDVINPNNFVLVGKRIKIVDNITQNINNPTYLSEFSEGVIDNSMSTTDMMRVFLFAQDCSTECEYSKKMLPLRRQLFKKLAIAGIKNNLFVCNDKNLCYFEKVVENLCQANEEPTVIKSTLDDYMRKYNKNPKKVISEASKYIDEIFKPQEIEVF